MKDAKSSGEPATEKQKELIRAFGWIVPQNCSKKRASGMIYAANQKGLKVSKEYAKKSAARHAAEDEENRKEEDEIRREYERDEARDLAEWRKVTNTHEPKGCLAAMFGLF